MPSRFRSTLMLIDGSTNGDTVKYRFTWQRNGQPQPFAESSVEVPVRLVRAGDRWRCRVVPTDGDLDGPEAGSEEALVRAAGSAGSEEGTGPPGTPVLP